MKTFAIFWLGLLPICQGLAQESRFFRLVAPAATAITSIAQDGTLTWTNAQTNVTCTVQTAQTLAGASNWVDYVQVPISNVVTTLRLFDLTPPSDMALIPAGSFTMGNALDPSEGTSVELPLHTVYVSAFYMDQYLVTKALWDDVYQWATNHGYDFRPPGSGKALNHPVQKIDWYDAVQWCNARSEKEGRVPAYYTDAGQTLVYRTGWVTVNSAWVKWNAGYRLPTEAEWEKAARGGLSGHRFPWGDTISESQANYYSYWYGGQPYMAYDVSTTSGYNTNYNDGVQPYTSPVGSFAPNGYGLYDMAGNVFEWCWDWYGNYDGDSQADPRGLPSGSLRVLRGGCWGYGLFAYGCRTAYRNRQYPEGYDNFSGVGT